MNIQNIIIYLIALVFLASCTESLDSDYRGNSDNRLVIEGSITTDTMAHRVVLSRSVDFNAKNSSPEEGANVTISDGSVTFALSENKPGMYYTESDVYGLPGKTYTLTVELASGDLYTASSKMNSVSAIDSIRFVREDIPIAGEHYKAYFYGWEPEEPGHRYLWNLYLNDSLWNDTISEIWFEEDTWVNGQYIYDFDIYWLDPEKVPSADTLQVIMEMYSIPNDYYVFLIEVMSETTWRGGPFDPTPANVSTNISNNALGFFYAASISRQSVMYIKSEEEKEE